MMKHGGAWFVALVIAVGLGATLYPRGEDASDAVARINHDASEDPVMRRVWTVEMADPVGTISGDGRWISMADWSSAGNVALFDLQTGATRQLTRNGNGELGEAGPSAISFDGRRVAYSWYENEPARWSFRVIEVGAREPRVLLEGAYFIPHEWSPDGSMIAVTLFPEGVGPQIALVYPEDGRHRVLRTTPWLAPMSVSFSPDGRYIVYDLQTANSQGAPRDIFVMATDASVEMPVVAHPANDYVLGWAPDGGSVLFYSDRSGSPGIWRIPVDEGRAVGTPVLVQSDVWNVRDGLGFAQDGSFYLLIQSLDYQLYVGGFDQRTGRATDVAPVAVGHIVGRRTPTWSPDGTALAFRTERTEGQTRRVGRHGIAIRSTNTGEVREIVPRLAYTARLRWLPDGMLAVAGTDELGRDGVFRVDPATGDVSLLLRRYMNGFAVSPGGRVLYYSQRGDISGIFAHDLETGRVDSLYVVRRDGGHTDGVTVGLELTPDGRTLATVTWRDGRRSILTVPTAGGRVDTLLHVGSDSLRIQGYRISPDGRYVYFGLRLDSGGNIVGFYRIPVEGGPIEQVHVAPEGAFQPPASGLFRMPAISPDGQQVAFTAGESRSEVWVLEGGGSGDGE